MLNPDYLEQAGEKVASVYAHIESEMLDYLAARMISGDITNQRSQTALLLLAQSATTELASFITKHKGEISASVLLEVKDALTKSDKDDLARIKKGLGVNLPSITSKQIATTVAGVEQILARRNIDMTNGAKNAFLTQSIWAITQVNTGAMTTEKALHSAVRTLEREGISLISYKNTKTGVQTVKNKVDVAIRRHIRTQIAQDSMKRTEQVLDEAGVDLVEVSSHGGSRPSHAKWEGRIYSRHGDKVINGVKYKDFKTACKWGDIADGIGGANCRHSYAAYFPGMERSYKPEPKHPSGKSNEEVYELTQKQRGLERDIRATKRELKGAELLYEKSKSESDLGEVLQLRMKLRNQQKEIRSLVANNQSILQRSPRREWAGDMPKVRISAISAQSKKRALEAAELREKAARKGKPVYTERGDRLGTFGRTFYKQLAKPDQFAVILHGSPSFVKIIGKKSDHKLLADIIRDRKDYKEGTPVKLISCSTGNDSGDSPCFAQRLANELNVPVEAPTNTVWIYPDGHMTVGRRECDNDGEFKTFEPRKGKP